MKENDSQGKNRGDSKKLFLTISLSILALVLAAIAISFTVRIWCTDYTINSARSLEVAVAVLTILVAIVAIIVGLATWWTRREWEIFKKQQEPLIRETRDGLEKLKEEQDEIRWITTLKDKVLPTDPYLRREESQEVVESITHHYNKDQDDGAWEMYGVGRSFDREHKYDEATKYYEEALKKYPTDKGLKLHIYQSLGLDYFLKGKQLVKDGDTRGAKEDYEQAIRNYDSAIQGNPHSVEAFDNKGNTYIELAKISSDNKKEQLVCINKAIECYDDAIGKRVERDRQWWATCHFDKARALALRAEKDNREDLDEVAKELKETITTFVTKSVGFDVPEIFQDFENVKYDNEIKRLLDLLHEVALKAVLIRGD